MTYITKKKTLGKVGIDYKEKDANYYVTKGWVNSQDTLFEQINDINKYKSDKYYVNEVDVREKENTGGGEDKPTHTVSGRLHVKFNLNTQGFYGGSMYLIKYANNQVHTTWIQSIARLESHETSKTYVFEKNDYFDDGMSFDSGNYFEFIIEGDGSEVGEKINYEYDKTYDKGYNNGEELYNKCMSITDDEKNKVKIDILYSEKETDTAHVGIIFTPVIGKD